MLVYNIIQFNKGHNECYKRLWVHGIESKGLTSRADRRQDSLVKLVCRTQWKALTRVAGSDRRYLRLTVYAKPYVVRIALRLQESSSPLSGHAALPADLGTGRGWLSNTPSCSPPPPHHTSPSRRLYRSADIGPPPPHHMFVCCSILPFPRSRTIYNSLQLSSS